VTAVFDHPIVIQATDYIDPADSVVKSAALLADAVVVDLQRGGAVTIDLSGIRSLSSSYFNTLLSRVADQCGVEAIRDRLQINCPSPAQKAIFDRSYQAVLKRFGA
jgi:hypothetical protein